MVNPLFWVDQATNKDNVNATMSSKTVGEFKIPFLTNSKALKEGDLICLDKVAVKAKAAKLADAEVGMTEAKKRKTGKALQ